MTDESVTLTEEEYEDALSRLRDWASQIANAEADADRDSLDRAADLASVFESKLWVGDLPPKKALAKRKQRTDTQQEFARWTALFPEKVGRKYSPARVSQLLSVVHIKPLIINGVNNKGEFALRPLTGKFAKDHPDEVAAVLRRAREIADGAPLTQSIVRKALADHNKLVRPPLPKVSTPPVKDEHAEEKKIRADFKRLLDLGRRKDAGELLNLLIGDYKAPQ